MEKKVRKKLRLNEYDYSSEGLYFITICVDNFRLKFGEIQDGYIVLNDLGKYVKNSWMNISIFYPNLEIHEFVIMPNHLHGIIEIWDYKDDINIGKAIKGFKSVVTKYYREKGLGKKLWQRGFHDHIIRNQDSLSKIRTYILENPVKWEEDKFFVK